MENNIGQDIEGTHTVLNYLYACFQGGFAAQNMLSQLGYHGFNPDDLQRSQAALGQTDRWLQQLWQGHPILSRSWLTPQTPDAKEALALLSKVRGEISQVVNKVERLVAEENNLQEDSEGVKYLIATYARFAYTNENYVKGFIEYGKVFAQKALSDTFSTMLPQAEQNIETAHMFFNIFTKEQNIHPIFFQGLREEAVMLPGALRTNMHDLNHLSHFYTEFDFKAAQIPETEAIEWGHLQVDPITAGFWQAYDISPIEMRAWSQFGFTDPRTVWFWRSQGFQPKDAQGWFQAGFVPPQARLWREEGHSLQEAAASLAKGVPTPQRVRYN